MVCAAADTTAATTFAATDTAAVTKFVSCLEEGESKHLCNAQRVQHGIPPAIGPCRGLPQAFFPNDIIDALEHYWSPDPFDRLEIKAFDQLEIKKAIALKAALHEQVYGLARERHCRQRAPQGVPASKEGSPGKD